MASESSSLSQSSLTINDEFEGLEVTEFDANALWELLYDEPGKEEAESGGGAPMQAMEVVGPNPDSVVESYWSLDDINNNNNNNNNSDIQDFDWLHIMEETSTPCNDMGVWYEGPCMEEIFEIGDYSLSHGAMMSDEIGYIGLWQDN